MGHNSATVFQPVCRQLSFVWEKTDRVADNERHGKDGQNGDVLSEGPLTDPYMFLFIWVSNVHYKKTHSDLRGLITATDAVANTQMWIVLTGLQFL